MNNFDVLKEHYEEVFRIYWNFDYYWQKNTQNYKK